MPKFGTKNGLFILFTNLLSYMKSAPKNLCNYKMFPKKMKIPKFGTKYGLFVYFWARLLKKLQPYLK